MTCYYLNTTSTSTECQALAHTLSQQLMSGAWEETLQQFVQYYSYQELIAWAVILPTSKDINFRQCLDDMQCWVLSPNEALRWKVFAQAQAIGFSTVVGALGLSLFWSQGSMTAAEFTPVYPQPHLPEQMLLCALKLLCVELAADDVLPLGAHRLLSHWFEQRGKSCKGMM